MSSLVERYTKIFTDCDSNSDGSLDYDELLAMMRENGYPGSDEEIKHIFKKMDTSGDNLISLQEFLDAMGMQDDDVHKSAFMRSMFEAFDRDGNGEIDKDELKKAFEKMGKYFTDDMIEKILAVADTDQSGTINYEEFIAKAVKALH